MKTKEQMGASKLLALEEAKASTLLLERGGTPTMTLIIMCDNSPGIGTGWARASSPGMNKAQRAAIVHSLRLQANEIEAIP